MSVRTDPLQTWQSMRITLVQTPYWSIITPAYSVALLTGNLRRRGFLVSQKCFDVPLYRACSEIERQSWRPANTKFWNDEAAVLALIRRHTDLVDGWADEILRDRPDLVGFSVKSWSLWFSLSLAERLKRRQPGVWIAFGGPEMSQGASPGEFLQRHRQVDIVCRHEADVSLPRFLEKMSPGMQPQPEPGFAFRDRQGQTVDCGVVSSVPMPDDVPYADYSDYDFRQYADPSAVTLALSRGCINRCSFCSESPAFMRYRAFPATRVFDEIRHHAQATNCAKPMRIAFCDSLLNGDMQQLLEFADLLIAHQTEMRLTYGGPMFVRDELTDAVVAKLARSGLTEVLFGLESGSEAVLAKMRKRFRLETASRVFERFHRHGITLTASVIFGHPGETEAEFHQSLDFLRANAPHVDQFFLNYLGLYGQSPMAVHPEKYGIDPQTFCPTEWTGDEGRNTFAVRNARVNLARLALGDKVGDIGAFSDEEGVYDPASAVKEDLARLKRRLTNACRRRLDGLTVREFVPADPQTLRGSIEVVTREEDGWKIRGWTRNPSDAFPAEEIILANQHGTLLAWCCVDTAATPFERPFSRIPVLTSGWDAFLDETRLDGGKNEIRAFVYDSRQQKAYELAGVCSLLACVRRTPADR